MNRKIEIRCRLAALLEERGMTLEELAEASGLSLEQLEPYMSPTPETVSLPEIGAMLEALDGAGIGDLFESVARAAAPTPAESDAPPMFEDEWFSPCPAASGGRHVWHKDVAVSDTVYQEFVCEVCRRRISVIL